MLHPFIVGAGFVGDTCLLWNKITWGWELMLAEECDGDVNSGTLAEQAAQTQLIAKVALLASFGLGAQCATVLRMIGMHEWGSESTAELVRRSSGASNAFYSSVPEELRQRSLALIIDLITCWVCPQSDSAQQAVRAVLDGTADQFSGIDALTELHNATIRPASALLFSNSLCLAAIVAERVGLFEQAQQYAERALGPGGQCVANHACRQTAMRLPCA